MKEKGDNIFKIVSREKANTIMQPKISKAQTYQIGLAHDADPEHYLNNEKKVSTKDKAVRNINLALYTDRDKCNINGTNSPR